MKIFWTTLATLAALGLQPAVAYSQAYQDNLLIPQGRDSTQPGQRGRESTQPGQKARESSKRRWENNRRQGQEQMPWEVRPWAQQNAADEGQRVGRKAQNERFEQKMENIHEHRDHNQAAQQPQGKWQGKWQRHHMESERFNSQGLPPR